ncbi:hypothetical protein BCIN_04g02770 [Botrytis cinerea B05.10]|uniref:Uncharacterized protein n=1 Tax=Botryotinia fuckeliana (strain B05.10) TaxID=332648 RepID=A0A384JER1_BOTFB|nr:hypothetical protein BCIN_04g02770 [Botrytis cinerea B05.10]ATZ49086.1 hypothetical protein BCIN_04g02770 [Botrytis cinerea B05.10]
MCMFRITTYDDCWGQYTHLLICSNESSNKSELNSPQDRVLSALKCPNLKSEHINIGGSRCDCKIKPRAFKAVCKRKWGGDFVGSVNCSMNPGSAVKFQFRSREWENCTNVESLLRGGSRILPADYNPTAQAWNDSEWDGDSKQVDWRDKDWVTLAEKGMSTWQRRQKGRHNNVQDPMIPGLTQVSEQNQTYEEVQLEKSEIFSTEHNLTSRKGQKLPPQHDATNQHVGTVSTAVVDWSQLKEQHKTTVGGQHLPPSLPSVGRSQYQKKASIPHINQVQHGRKLTKNTDHQNQQIVLPSLTATAQTAPIVPTGPNAMPIWEAERSRGERKNSRGVQSGGQPTAATEMRSVTPLGPKVMPVWQLAQVLKERQELEKKNIAAALGEYRKMSMDPAAAAAARENNINDQYASQSGTQTSTPLEISSPPVSASENSQDQGERKKYQKGNNFLPNTDKQRVVLQENKSKDQVRESGPSFQGNFQHVNAHIPRREDNNPSTNETLGKPWNGVPEYVVSQEYNDTLPESDDRNFNFTNYSPSKQTLEKVRMADINEASESAPESLRKTLQKAPITVLENPQAAPYSASDSPHREYLAPLEPLQVERPQARYSSPEYQPYLNLSGNELEVKKGAVKEHQEIAEQSEPQDIEREQRTQHNIQTRRQSDALIQEPSHSQENFQRKAFRKLREIEEQSRIPGNKNMRDLLHDFSQLDAYLQDFTLSQQGIAREMWMAEKAKVDKKFSKFYGSIATPNKEVTDSPHVNDKVVKQPRQNKVDEENDVEEKSVEDRSLPRINNSPASIPIGSELSRLLKKKRKTELVASMLHDQDRKERFVRDVPFLQQNLARDGWIIEAELTDCRLQKILDQIRTCVVSVGVENCVEDVEYTREEIRQAEDRVLKRVNQKFAEQLRNIEHSSKIREEKQIREAQKQKKNNDRKSFKEQNPDGNGADLSNHTGDAEGTNNQQGLISTSIKNQAMGDITDADDEANIEVQQKRKRDIQYFGYSPPTSAKKRKPGEDGVVIESKEAHNQRMRDLYYAGLIPSMGDVMSVEKADAAKLQVENKRDQDKRKGDSQYSNPTILKDDKSSNKKPQAKNSGRQIWIDVDYEAQEKVTKTSGRKDLIIPDSFHRSFPKQFPKLPNESKADYRQRKLAAYIISEEHKKVQSAGSVTWNSTATNGQKQVSSDGGLSEYLPSGAYFYLIRLIRNHAELTRYTVGMNQSNLSGAVGTQAKKKRVKKPKLSRQAKTDSAREEYLRKQDARKLGEQRQQVGNKGNARKAGVVGKLVGGKTDLEDQILSDTSDNKGLADYGSEKNDYMKTEGSSRSQSRGAFGNQQFQSSNPNLSAVVQHNDAVIAGSNIETAIDLTSD